MLRAVTLCPLVNAILTNTTFPVALLMFAVPSVMLYAVLLIAVPVGMTSLPLYAPPLLPLPPLPVSLPDKPTPLYCVVPSIQPLSPLLSSVGTGCCVPQTCNACRCCKCNIKVSNNTSTECKRKVLCTCVTASVWSSR